MIIHVLYTLYTVYGCYTGTKTELTAMAMNNLGTIYFNRGEYERAMPLFTVCILYMYCVQSIMHAMY